MSGTDYVSPVENICIRYRTGGICKSDIDQGILFQRESCPKKSTSLESVWLVL